MARVALVFRAGGSKFKESEMKFMGICPGHVRTKYIEVECETPQEALEWIWQKIFGSDYVSRILEWDKNEQKYDKEVYTESKGFR